MTPYNLPITESEMRRFILLVEPMYSLEYDSSWEPQGDDLKFYDDMLERLEKWARRSK